MQVFKLNPNAKHFTTGNVVTIGNFDGVHLGHQAIIRSALSVGQKKNLPVTLVLFEPQPKEFFNPTCFPARLFGLREKIYMLKQLGIDYVVCIHFDSCFSVLLPKEFFLNFLMDALHAKHIVIGKDFYFGKSRLGTPEAMKAMAFEAKIQLDIFDFYYIDDLRVSSTLIREYLQQGALEQVKKMLGEPYYMIGRVGHGKKLGQQLEVPTANIAISRYKSALNGVFCVRIKSCHSDDTWQGIANIGKRPTVNGQKKVLEVHIFDFQDFIYGKFLKISFLHKIRDEIKFESLEALKHQINKDIVSAKHFFEH